MSDKPIWVAIALPDEEARATLNAVRATFMSLTITHRLEEAGPLARAIVRIAEACDRARDEAA